MTDVKLEPEAIWLSPQCDEYAEGRSWANPAPEDACDDCGLPWVKYIRADLASHQPQREAVLETLDWLRSQRSVQAGGASVPRSALIAIADLIQRKAALTTPAPAVSCSTCGATDPGANVLCSNGFHAPPAVSTDEIVAALEALCSSHRANLYPAEFAQAAAILSRIRGEGE